MKLMTLALASAFALSSTFALAYTTHHKYRTSVRTHSAGSMDYGRYYGNRGQYYGSGRYYGSPNARGGLVGGGDTGTYRP